MLPHDLSGLGRGDVLGVCIDDRDGEPVVPQVGGDHGDPERRFYGREVLSQRLVHLLPVPGIYQHDIGFIIHWVTMIIPRPGP